ncbi:ClpXP protease specificity-enhancing factor SspB [Amaricoccus sp.]|uniref:ClpXP protease specificity-enhancing factor SspB n=1 Tax=Amaricoccus sp. TaxID=1872485 RepID=UPI0026057850|nr:ClpXP protease specificity-enhancing factor SspB [uncultured Amaricoccus sp.]
MAKGIDYGQLMNKAFRRLIADVLTQVARDGLPGKHHFFISFDTAHPGVDMSNRLRKLYPGEMTIVLQEWFTDLAVMKDRFTVTLNFGNIPEPIVIPLDAIVSFMDPSIKIGFKFDERERLGEEDDDEAAEPEVVVSLDKFRNR